MSLTDWVYWDSELIDVLFFKPEFKHSQYLLKCNPLTANYGTVGTAFDYLLRIYIYLHNYNNVPNQRSDGFEHTISNSGLINYFPITATLGATNKIRKDFIYQFINKLATSVLHPTNIKDFIPDCITLSKLESVYRSGKPYPDSHIFSFDDNDIIDLSNLISIVEPSLFSSNKQCILNPTFGQSSKDVGGGDADLIIDDTLIDIKTTKYSKFEKEYFRQLVGYYLLNLREHNLYGDIKHLGIYFSRYGILFKFPIPPMNPISNISWLSTKQKKTYDCMTLINNSIEDYDIENH